MNSQDITRALIDTTVARAMVEMDADPKRSVRKLCDLGRQFSRGRFQNQIFAIFQDLPEDRAVMDISGLQPVIERTDAVHFFRHIL